MAHPVDVHVGKKLRSRRWLLGLTQQDLGEAVGIRFQQIQKYESGANRVSASRLWDIAQALGVPVSYFFEGLGAEAPAANGMENGFHKSPAGTDGPQDRETIDLIRAYNKLASKPRRHLLDLAKSLGDAAA